MTEPHIYIVPARVMRAAECQVEIDEIHDKFPKLVDYDPEDYCCEGCGWTDVYEDLGPEAADAWERINDLYFLMLGELEEVDDLEFEPMGFIDIPVLEDCDE